MRQSRDRTGQACPHPHADALSRVVESLRRSPVLQADQELPSQCLTDDPPSPDAWSEEDIVQLHWRLLQEVSHLADPQHPLDEKFDTLRWVFTERDKDEAPFSFVRCLHVVGCSPLSPIPYCGQVDPEELRDRLRNSLRGWITATLARYPTWVREAVINNPQWVQAQLERNPQWINEQIQRVSRQTDLFA